MIYCVYFSELYEPDWGHTYFKHRHNAEDYRDKYQKHFEFNRWVDVEMEEIHMQDEEEE